MGHVIAPMSAVAVDVEAKVSICCLGCVGTLSCGDEPVEKGEEHLEDL